MIDDRTGLVLAHGGEFSVALIALALGNGLFDVQSSQPTVNGQRLPASFSPSTNWSMPSIRSASPAPRLR